MRMSGSQTETSWHVTYKDTEREKMERNCGVVGQWQIKKHHQKHVSTDQAKSGIEYIHHHEFTKGNEAIDL